MRSFKPATASQEALEERLALITFRYLPHAQRRALEGNRFYPGIAALYEEELEAIRARLAVLAGQQQQRRAA